MKKTVYFFWLIFFSFALNAQEFSLEKWHYGEIDLNSGETLKGFIRYNFKDNIVDYNWGKTYRKFSARNLSAFQIKDTLTQQIRTFYTFLLPNLNQDLVPSFLELLVEGDISLLSRSFIKHKTRNYYNSSFSGLSVSSYRALEHDFFIIKNHKKIIPLPISPQDIINSFNHHKEKLETYRKKNRLKLSKKTDIIKIVNYYNALNRKQ